MRFLCLHGMGTNSNILETQLSHIRGHLGSACEFVFLDGEVECPPAKGISRVFPGPYLCYYPAIPTETQLAAAHKLVRSVIEDEGPFDGLLGFSQGAALCASFLLQHIANFGRSKSLPVQCAVFICGSLPWIRLDCSSNSITQTGPTEAVCTKDCILSDKAIEILISEVHATADKEAEEQPLDPSKRIRPTTSSLRISIPTAHILGGSKDEYFLESQALAGLGDEKGGLVKTFDHGHGHVIPRDVGFTRRMAETIMWAVNRVKFRH